MAAAATVGADGVTLRITDGHTRSVLLMVVVVMMRWWWRL